MQTPALRRSFSTMVCLLTIGFVCVQWFQPATAVAGDKGFVSIFDGKTLDGWDGNPAFWRVEDGAITGETTPDNPTKPNTFLIWRGGEPGDFELKLEYKLYNHNSGVQYRSFEVPDIKWAIGGYQADIEGGDKYSGIMYGERFRGILAQRGQKTEIGENHKPTVVGRLGDSAELQSKIRKEDWNEYHIIAKGNHFIHKINDVVMVEVTDNDTEMRRSSGLIALQLHQGPPMKVQFRNIRLKQLDAKPKTSQTEKKKVVFIAGTKSHGYGAHEHKAGCMLFAKIFQESGLPIEPIVVTEGWPKDDSVLDSADAIVVYCDGGGRHPYADHLDRVDELSKKGVGLAFIHYGVEIPKGPGGDKFLEWMGGYFETDWSVNPHWEANYKALPEHPVTRGVKPFSMQDEWYYHMRFRENMEGITPILTDLPPQSTLTRKDGAHSNNPYVREAVAAGQPQHMAWAALRPDGGRGFGMTGGHFHWNWGSDPMRKLMLNAIVWVAKGEVPAEGVPSKTPTVAELEANQDFPKPDNYNPARIQAMLDQWNGN